MLRLKLNREIASATYDSVSKAFNEAGNIPEDGMRLVIDEAKRIAKINRDVPLSEIADLSILKGAQR